MDYLTVNFFLGRGSLQGGGREFMTEKESRMKMMDQIITAACGPAKSDHATHRHLIRSCIFNRTVCRVRL